MKGDGKRGSCWPREGGSNMQEIKEWGSSFHSWGNSLANMGVRLIFIQQERGQLQVVQGFSNKRCEKRWTLPLHSFSTSTSFHSMLHGHLCLLRCVEVSLNELHLVMCLLVQRSLEPHCWLKQRRRWIKFLSQLDKHGPHLEWVLFLMDGRIQHAIHS